MATELFGKANEAFVNENYTRAVELYSDAIEADDTQDDYYSNRAQAYLKLDQFTAAIGDCKQALNINPKHVKSILRKGIALYNLKEYNEAIDTFEKGENLDDGNDAYQIWIEKCRGQIPPESQSTETASAVESETTCLKPKYDWYQTASHVIITVLLKNVIKEDFSVDIQNHSLSATVRRKDNEVDHRLEVYFAHLIQPEQSFHKVMSTKIEIKLKKQEGIQWIKLEGDDQVKTVKALSAVVTENVPLQYPSSNQASRDWDKLAQEVSAEEKDEKKEGDAALNNLFQQIYSDGSDEVRRAMAKSFYESGGTVLSTNWSEVGTKEVEIKPPDGMEWKKY